MVQLCQKSNLISNSSLEHLLQSFTLISKKQITENSVTDRRTDRGKPIVHSGELIILTYDTDKSPVSRIHKHSKYHVIQILCFMYRKQLAIGIRYKTTFPTFSLIYESPCKQNDRNICNMYKLFSFCNICQAFLFIQNKDSAYWYQVYSQLLLHVYINDMQNTMNNNMYFVYKT